MTAIPSLTPEELDRLQGTQPETVPPDIEAALAAIDAQTSTGITTVAGPEMADVPSSFEAERAAGAPLQMPEIVRSNTSVDVVPQPMSYTSHPGHEALHDLAEERSAAMAGSALTGAAVGAGVSATAAYMGGAPLLGAGLTSLSGLATGVGVGAAVGSGLYMLGRHYHYTARRGKQPRGILGTMFIDGPVGLVMSPIAALNNLRKRTFGKK